MIWNPKLSLCRILELGKGEEMRIKKCIKHVNWRPKKSKPTNQEVEEEVSHLSVVQYSIMSKFNFHLSFHILNLNNIFYSKLSFIHNLICKFTLATSGSIKSIAVHILTAICMLHWTMDYSLKFKDMAYKIGSGCSLYIRHYKKKQAGTSRLQLS